MNRSLRQTQQQNDELESATNVSALPFAVHGEYKQTSEPLVFLQTGDVTGHSPCYLTVDQNGDSQWVSFDQVRITDIRALPVQIPQGQGSQSRSRSNR